MKVYADPIIQICIKMEPEDLRKVCPDDVFFEPGSGVKNHRGTQRFRAFVKLFFLVKDKDYWGNEQKIEAATLTLHYIKLRQPAVSFWKKENGQYKKLDEEEKMSKVKGTIDGYSKDRTKIDEKSFETDKDILSFYEKVKGEGNVQAVVTKVKELLMKDFNLAAYDETMTGMSNGDNQMNKRVKVIQDHEKPDLYEILEVHTFDSPPMKTKFAVVERMASRQDDSCEQEDEYHLDTFFLCDEEQNIVASTDMAMVAKQARDPLGVSDDNYPLNRLMDSRRKVVLSLSIQFMNILETFCQYKDENTVLPKILLTKQYLYIVKSSSVNNHKIWVEEKLNGNKESSVSVFKADSKSHFEGDFCSNLLNSKPSSEHLLIRMPSLEQDDNYEDFKVSPEDILHAFSYFSSLNNSPYLLVEVKYVYFAQEKIFKLTDPIIYSDGLLERFGTKDLGKKGINEYKKEHSRHCLNPICKRLKRHFQNLSKTYLTKT